MKVLLWHGYLMSGTGSNIYTANVARAWKAHGHDVTVMCQERHPERFDFVDSSARMGPENTLPVSWDRGERNHRCRIVRPFIGSVLPVYVLDVYEGIEAKTFVDLTGVELTRYTDANIDALHTAIEILEPDAIVTGHEVMGPYIAREACLRTGKSYVAKLHGSALEYAVKRQDRYLRFASQGLEAARYVVGGSRYMIEEAASVLPGWEDKARVINPGCDVDLFHPLERTSGNLTIGYVGKLIASKGVDHLLAALPLIEARAEVVIVGFGGDEAQLRALWSALQAGDREEVLTIARRGDLAAHASLYGFLESRSQDYFERVRAIDLTFVGRLDHGPLSKVLPTFDVLVAPSVVAEAFGMVAAEAAACGVLPVVPRHSGIGEAGRVLEVALGMEGSLTFDPAEPVAGIARAVDGLLSMSSAARKQKGADAAAIARKLWSWDVVADKLLALAA